MKTQNILFARNNFLRDLFGRVGGVFKAVNFATNRSLSVVVLRQVIARSLNIFFRRISAKIDKTEI